MGIWLGLEKSYDIKVMIWRLIMRHKVNSVEKG